MYLNKVYFERELMGCRLRQAYFGKDVSQLNLAESALIAEIGEEPE